MQGYIIWLITISGLISVVSVICKPVEIKDQIALNNDESVDAQTDSKVSQELEKYHGMRPNPEELGTYFEGDIHSPTYMLKNGLLNDNFRWRNGIVPVEVRGDFDPKELDMINTAFEMYHNSTCIQFKQHSSEKDFVTITKNLTGCWSSLGKIGGKQILNLQSPMCLLKIGTTVHELMHVLGFNHEHTREDRDEYVQVNWKNIPSDLYKNFGKSLPNSTNSFKIKYDYESILHYSPFAFAINSKKPTLVPLKKSESAVKMGQRVGLSKSDIDKIWKMYKCKWTTLNLRKTNKSTRLKKFK